MLRKRPYGHVREDTGHLRTPTRVYRTPTDTSCKNLPLQQDDFAKRDRSKSFSSCSIPKASEDGFDAGHLREIRPTQQPVSPACTDVAPLGNRHPRAVPRVGDGQGPRGRCARRGGASQGRTAMGTNMGPPCRSGVAGTPPRTGTRWKQPRGQLLPPVRGNARRRVWRRRTKSRRRSGCRGCTRSGTRSWPRDSRCV